MRQLKGVFPLLYTPFDADLSVDQEDVRRQVQYAVGQGAHGLAINGSDSEALKLSFEERRLVVEWVLDEVDGRVPVLVGISAAATVDSVSFARHACDSGAAGVFGLPPLSGEATSNAVFAHFEAISQGIGIPIMVQERLVLLSNCILERMAIELETVRYVKEERPISAGQRIAEILSITDRLDVFSAGENIMNELFRGAAGVMPSCIGLAGYVSIFENHTHNNLSVAWEEYRRLLPLLAFRRQVNSILLTKEILRRKGVFKSVRSREPVGYCLDAYELRMLDTIVDIVGSPI